ncbi:MAG: hypothetical protein KY468_01705 [Armatimonadetes bacterium]|nr:hypothetical protein [Armatimonadota bacterium]
MNRRIWPRSIARGVGGLLLVAMLAFVNSVGLTRLTSGSPFLAFGPYHGRKRPDAPGRKPNQVFPAYAGLTLRVYDPVRDEPAPTVELLDSRGKMRWRIYAVPNGSKDKWVHRLRFHTTRGFPYLRPRVVGRVHWIMGREKTWWLIRKDGALIGYWYSF